jgi:hypothetical protein
MDRMATARDRRHEREGLENAYFIQVFRPRVMAAATLSGARALAAEQTPAEHPGHAVHVRFAAFVARWEVPPRAPLPERLMYMTLARKLTDAGELSEVEFFAIEQRFRRASPPRR